MVDSKGASIESAVTEEWGASSSRYASVIDRLELTSQLPATNELGQ
jgi:hypothetical protein